MQKVSYKRSNDVSKQTAEAPDPKYQVNSEIDGPSAKVSKVGVHVLQKPFKPTLADSIARFFLNVAANLAECEVKCTLEKHALNIRAASVFGLNEIESARVKFVGALASFSLEQLQVFTSGHCHPYFTSLKSSIVTYIEAEESIASDISKDRQYEDIIDQACSRGDFITACFFATKVRDQGIRDTVFMEIFIKALMGERSVFLSGLIEEGFNLPLAERVEMLKGIASFEFDRGNVDRGIFFAQKLQAMGEEESYQYSLTEGAYEMVSRQDRPSLLKIVALLPKHLGAVSVLVEAELLQKAEEIANDIKLRDESEYTDAMMLIADAHYENNDTLNGFRCTSLLTAKESWRYYMVLGYRKLQAIGVEKSELLCMASEIVRPLCRAEVLVAIDEPVKALITLKAQGQLGNEDAQKVLFQIFHKFHELNNEVKAREVFNLMLPGAEKVSAAIKIEPVGNILAHQGSHNLPESVLVEVVKRFITEGEMERRDTLYGSVSAEVAFRLQTRVDDFASVKQTMEVFTTSFYILDDGEGWGPSLQEGLPQEMASSAVSYVRKLCNIGEEESLARASELSSMMINKKEKALMLFCCFNAYKSMGNNERALEFAGKISKTSVFRACAYMDLGLETQAKKELGNFLQTSGDFDNNSYRGFGHFVTRYLDRGEFEGAREAISFIGNTPGRIELALRYIRVKREAEVS